MTSNNLLLAIKGHIYEVSHFVSKHPGEGINNVYLNEYNKREVNMLFAKFHQTEESEEHLIRAREGNHDRIKYIGEYYFQKRIPKYYHLLKDLSEIDSEKYERGCFFIFPNLEDSKQLNLFVKDKMGMISVHHMKLVTDDDNKLTKAYVEICFDMDKDKNPITKTIESDNVENFMEKYFIKDGYKPLLLL